MATAEEARDTDAEAAAQVVADRDQATADQARATAEAALMAAYAAQAAAEEISWRGEDRPSITVIGGDSGTASVSGTGTGTGSASGTATGVMAGTYDERGWKIPTGLSNETEGPTKTDGYYTATTNREIFQKISTEYQEIAKLTNAVREGEPLPAAEIWLLYEAGSHTRLGNSSRTLRAFATCSSPATYFPESAEFYGSATFLDAPIQNAVRGRGEAENCTDAQKRQAIQKGALRILYHWAKFQTKAKVKTTFAWI